MEMKVRDGGNGSKDKRPIYAGGISLDEDSTEFAKEFITVGNTIEESMGRTVFIDDRQLNAVIALYRKLLKFHNLDGMRTLKMWLDGRPAIGGYNLARGVMVGVGIVVGEALGVKLGKDSMKFIEKQILAKASQRQHNDGENNG